MLNKVLVVLLSVITVLSLVVSMGLFGISVTGAAVKEVDNAFTGMSLIISGLIVLALIILIIDLIRSKKK